MVNRCSKSCATVIFFCMCWSRATSQAVPTTNKLMSSAQCHELSKLLRQESVATVRHFLNDHKISATEKTCVGPTCEGGECCRCCSHGRCSTVQEWANDLGITASLSPVKHPVTPQKTGWGHYHQYYLNLLAQRSHLIRPYLSYIPPSPFLGLFATRLRYTDWLYLSIVSLHPSMLPYQLECHSISIYTIPKRIIVASARTAAPLSVPSGECESASVRVCVRMRVCASARVSPHRRLLRLLGINMTGI